MPEGDSIWLDAQRLRPALEDETLVFADARHQAVAAGLAGSLCGPVETLGKHLLLTFEGGDLDEPLTLRVHLGMKGSWRVSDLTRRRPGNFDEIGLILETQHARAVLRFPKELERFRARERPLQRALQRLGPDLLDDAFDPEDAAARAFDCAQQPEFEGLALHQALLKQSIACGIGNVYKSEALFMERLHPFDRVAQTDRKRLVKLYTRASRLMRANLRPGPRNTTGRRRPNTWVYEGHRRGCLRCGAPIQVAKKAGVLKLTTPPRSTWWCPRCQAPADAESAG